MNKDIEKKKENLIFALTMIALILTIVLFIVVMFKGI